MTTTLIVQLVEVHCYKCSISFGIPDYMKKELLDNGADFWCPNGHGQHYSESEVQKLEKKLLNEKSGLDYAKRRLKYEELDHQGTKNSLRSTKAAHTRTKNRIHNGVCPQCNRYFANVHRHMTSQHPEEAMT